MGTSDDISWLRLEDYAESTRDSMGIPGLALGVYLDGEILTAGFGVSHAEKGTPVWGETLFQIGSITKTFTAALVMQLAESGDLDLDASVRSLLPGFRLEDESAAERVTLRNLLTHSGGWDGDLFIETGDGADALSRYVARLANRAQLFEPGEYFSYNNSGFAVLGEILEKISGEAMEALYEERIFKPIGLERAYLNPAGVITEDFVVGHRNTAEGPEVARPWRLPRGHLPLGGIITNTADLLRYASSLMHSGWDRSGYPLLEPGSIEQMWSPQLEIHASDRTSVGLSWMRRDLDEGYLIYHSGGTNGQITRLSMVPEKDFAIAVLTNSDAGRKATEKITASALKWFLGITLESPSEIASSRTDLAVYSGSATRPGYELHLQMMGSQLVGLLTSSVGFPTESDPPMPPEPPFRISRCGPDRLIALEGRYEGLPIDVLRDAAGQIQFLRLSSRLYRWN